MRNRHQVFNLKYNAPLTTTDTTHSNLWLSWEFVMCSETNRWNQHLLLCKNITYSSQSANSRLYGIMMTSSNGNIFRVTGHLCGEFTGYRWIPRTKASDAGLWCFLCVRINNWINSREVGDLRRHRAYYGVTVMIASSRSANRRNKMSLIV